MRFFLDTANLEEIKAGAAWGMVNGVTTNPTFIAREGVAMDQQIRKICDIVDGEISAEVIALDTAGMLIEGRKPAKIHKNVVVKVPLTRDGIRACSTLRKVMDSLFNHPLTDKGIDQFLKDYHKAFDPVNVTAR